ncbi:hypothetical protein TSOC_009114 [Tetrabaena socialis]|uniref:Pherophorin domain-containing protein n=1 Tax=Tetrabaena socialis TaxID=47790 RepID=A0A2J7ZWN6_9CHLO|nr:hypothetical protein TSOC_009114 [Tetrabaena socialis]|eukprot:PNH04674.1 hypothetical protein TSOC_009114 [Tetrabaena socialis]
MTANGSAPSRCRGASCGAPTWRSLSAPFGAIGMILALGALGVGHASYLTGSKFPFEGCIMNTMYSPFYATLDDYKENPEGSTSQFCISLHVAPGCTPGKYRCCNTSINKLKLFPAMGCRGSLANAILSGKTINRTVNSIYWEEHEGSDIVKITPLMEWFNNAENIDGARICINLRKPCWTLPTLSHNGKVLEYALYDKKVNNYECCPVGLFNVTRDTDPLDVISRVALATSTKSNF